MMAAVMPHTHNTCDMARHMLEDIHMGVHCCCIVVVVVVSPSTKVISLKVQLWRLTSFKMMAPPVLAATHNTSDTDTSHVPWRQIDVHWCCDCGSQRKGHLLEWGILSQKADLLQDGGRCACFHTTHHLIRTSCCCWGGAPWTRECGSQAAAFVYKAGVPC